MPSRPFFPQAAMDLWLADGKVELLGQELTFLTEGRTFQIEEAVFVRSEVTGTACPRDLVGKVKRNSVLLELGAEILEESMVLGDNAYEITCGWIGDASVPFTQYLKNRGKKDKEPAANDEALLLREV